MKKLVIFLVAIFAFVAFANAQKIYSIPNDTIQGAETVNFATVNSSTSAGALTFQALCTELGGTSDGTLIWQGSVDGLSFQDITETTGLFNFYPNDTLTITDGAVSIMTVTNSPFKYYRAKGVGTTGDTTLISIKYVPKLR
jgi:hypothetical protein